LPGICQQVPPCQLRCRSQAFSTSQRHCSSRHRPLIFRQVTLLGLRPSGAWSSYKASDNSSLSDYPLEVSPAGCAIPVLGWNTLGRTGRYLGSCRNRAFHPLQGLCPCKKQPRQSLHG
jgi:hypothetical protein